MHKYTIVYTGSTLSINQVERWSAMHNYKKRKTLEDAFTLHLMRARVRPLAFFELTIRHNAGLDLDNLATTVKPFADAMKNKPLVLEDDARFWDSLHILYDPNIRKGEIHFEIVGPAATDQQIKEMKARKAKSDMAKAKRKKGKVAKRLKKL